MENFILNVLSGILIISIGAIPGFLSLKTTGNIRILLIALTMFTVVHGLYHFLDSIGFEFISDSVIRPISVLVLIAFGIITLILKRKSVIKGNTIKN